MSELNNKFVFVKEDITESEHIAAPKYSYWKSVFNFLIAFAPAIRYNTPE